VRVGYTFRDGGGPDQVATRLALTDKFADRRERRANAIASFETGDDSEGGAEIETRAQVSRSVNVDFLGTRRWRVGAEVFSDDGNTCDFRTSTTRPTRSAPCSRRVGKAAPICRQAFASASRTAPMTP
jgi:hypothetical protein